MTLTIVFFTLLLSFHSPSFLVFPIPILSTPLSPQLLQSSHSYPHLSLPPTSTDTACTAVRGLSWVSRAVGRRQPPHAAYPIQRTRKKKENMNRQNKYSQTHSCIHIHAYRYIRVNIEMINRISNSFLLGWVRCLT